MRTSSSSSPPVPSGDVPAGESPAARTSCRVGFSGGRGPAWWAWALALLAVMGSLLLLASSSSLWDRDEPRNARAAVEMRRSGDYLVPRFNEELRPDKPPLAYWHMSAWLELLGVNELAVRMPSILGMTATCALTAWIGSMLFGARVGWWSLWLLASSPLTLWLGSAATPDGTMLPWITLAIGTFVHRAKYGPRTWHWILLTVALGLGQLAKGPVALAIPVMTVVLSAVLLRRSGAGRWSKRDALWLASGAIGGFLLFAAWGVPAALREPELLRQGLGRHVFGRMTEAQEGHGGSGLWSYLALLPLYVPVIVGAFVPGVLLLPGTASLLVGKRLCGKVGRALLWGWLVPTFVLMSLVATKLPHYVFPMFPGLAIAAAAAMDAWRRKDPRVSEKDLDWLRRGGVKFYAPVALGAAIGLPVAGGVLFGPGRGLVFGLVGLVILAAAMSAMRAHLASRPERSVSTAIAGGALAGALALLLVMPAVESGVKPSRPLAAAMHAEAARLSPGDPSSIPVATSGYDEPSLVFYLDRPLGRPVASGVEPQGWVREGGPGLLAITQERLERLRAESPGLGRRLREVDRFETLNYSSGGRRQAIVLVARTP
ncbi:MAG: glycosyltransferase family 39 protein [Planctomycetota bacterium]